MYKLLINRKEVYRTSDFHEACIKYTMLNNSSWKDVLTYIAS